MSEFTRERLGVLDHAVADARQRGQVVGITVALSPLCVRDDSHPLLDSGASTAVPRQHHALSQLRQHRPRRQSSALPWQAAPTVARSAATRPG
eukprot:1845809-Prymnesium_polylepis.2